MITLLTFLMKTSWSYSSADCL